MGVAKSKSRPPLREEWDIENSRKMLNCLASIFETSIVHPTKPPQLPSWISLLILSNVIAGLLKKARPKALGEGCRS